jgi:prepilin-type N-terminal cleavage/methylation domain-containing protein
MRQTTQHQSNAGSLGVSWFQGLNPASHSPDHRSGFTLIEVVVAIAILLIVSIGFLRFSVVSYDWGTNIVIRSMAQNLAELTAEQLASSATSELQAMMSGTTVSPDFPQNGTGLSVHPPGDMYHVIAPGEFLVTGITSFFPATLSQVNLPTSDGHISALDPVDTPASPATQMGPADSDLQSIFGEGIPDIPSVPYKTYLYSLAPNVIVEPMEHVNAAGQVTGWDSGLVLFKSEFPHFSREITVTPSDATQERYAYSVHVMWTFGAQRQMVSVTGERSSVY